MSGRRHDILDLEGGGYVSINRAADAPPLTAEEQGAFRWLAAAALELSDRRRVEAAGFPFPIRRCPARGFGQ